MFYPIPSSTLPRRTSTTLPSPTMHLLAGAPDLGAPAEDVLDGTFSALEYLAADAERLYAAAEERNRA